MKKADIAMIILIASVGILIAYFIAINISFLRLPEQGAKVETIPELTDEVTQPSERVFNEDAINPTVEVIVGSGAAS